MSDTLTALQKGLLASGPKLVEPCFAYAKKSMKSTLELLDSGIKLSTRAKIVADPLWGPIKLSSGEALIADSPLVQRLRHVKQLGLACVVYPGACHDRLQHSFGVLAVVKKALDTLSEYREYPSTEHAAPEILMPGEAEVRALRLAAILHDCDHLPFSHALEPLLDEWFAAEIVQLRRELKKTFPHSRHAKPSEILTVVLVLSPSMSDVLAHWSPNPETHLDEQVASLILGSGDMVEHGYLAGLISGPLDCDKLDYMARDSEASGFPIGLDAERLLVALRPLRKKQPTVTSEDSGNVEKDRDDYVVGLSEAGITAFEQMAVARVLLYDRIYNHHKVRCAEAMLRESAMKVFPGGEGFLECALASGMDQLFLGSLEEAVKMRRLADGRNVSKPKYVVPVIPDTGGYSFCISERQLLKRALIMSQRYVKIPPSVAAKEQENEPMDLSTSIVSFLQNRPNQLDLKNKIHVLARSICGAVSDFGRYETGLKEDSILVAVSKDEGGVNAQGVFVQDRLGQIKPISHYFRASHWVDAYNANKQCAYVYCDSAIVPLVSLAAATVVATDQHVYFDVPSIAPEDFKRQIQQLREAGLVTDSVADGFLRRVPDRRPGSIDELGFDRELGINYGHFREEWLDAFNGANVGGFNSREWRIIGKATQIATSVYARCIGRPIMAEKSGRGEALCQERVLSLLEGALMTPHVESSNQSHDFTDATGHPVLAGGIADILVDNELVFELKYADRPPDPTSWTGGVGQCKLYANAVLKRFGGLFVFYPTKSDADKLPIDKSFLVTHRGSGDALFSAFLCFIPVHSYRPSDVKN